MKKLFWMAVVALSLACLDESETERIEDGKAFSLKSAKEVTYQTRSELDYEIRPSDIMYFKLFIGTKLLRVQVGRAGDPDSNLCIEGPLWCIERDEYELTLSDAELEEILERVAAVPDPECVRACDYDGMIETLSVDLRSVDTRCCGTVEGFGESIRSVIEYVKTLIPEGTPED